MTSASSFPFVLLLVLVVGCFTFTSNASASFSGGDPAALRMKIKQVYAALQAQQITHDQKFSSFPLQWALSKGEYESFVHLNFVGDEFDDLLRWYFAIPDSNMFVTTFVVSAIVEAQGLGMLEADAASLHNGLSAILKFHDKNKPASVPACVFWPQVNQSGLWTATPVNLLDPLENFDSFADFVDAILDSIGLGFLADRLRGIEESLSGFQAAFRIPADVDDSSVNLALGGILSQIPSSSPAGALYPRWEAANPDISALWDLELKYAYRPFDSPNARFTDLLDPRSFFFVNSFLYQQNPDKDFALVLTWLLDLPEENKTLPAIGMPFHTNNIDLTESANFLYGTAHAVLSGLNSGRAAQRFATDAKIQGLFNNTARLVAWGVQTSAVAARPDIGLLYYPSLYDFLWMSARTARFLVTNDATDKYPVLAQARDLLVAALRDAGTSQLIATARSEISGAYWDDFLGDYGGVERGEDRLFSTALAINTLIDIWTAKPTSASCQLQWDPQVPLSVQQLVAQAVAFLDAEILAGRLSLSNAFFSGSMKGMTTLPFAYPASYSFYRNGTFVDPHKGSLTQGSGMDLVYAMRGVPPREQFSKWMGQTWFGWEVPLAFQGFNYPASGSSGFGPWPFWSSPAMTHSLAILAFSNYVAVQECQPEQSPLLSQQ